MIERLNALIDCINNKNLDAIYLHDSSNIFYFSNFTGTNGKLLVFKDKILFFTDNRYTLRAKKEVYKDIEIIIEDSRDYIFKYIKENFLPIRTLGIIYSNIYYSEIIKFETYLSKESINFVDIKDCIENIRIKKNKNEIKIIKEAISIAEYIFNTAINYIKEGITERELFNKLYYLSLKNAEGVSFEPIVLFGENTAYIHGKSGDRNLKKGDFILIDYGIKYKGYCTDMTRTFVYNMANESQKEWYNIVLGALKVAENSIEKYDDFRNLHIEVINYFDKFGKKDYFLHSLGHGVGIDIHERPYISEKVSEKIVDNTVFTIEPGLYKENFGGIRIENMYILEDKKLFKLNKFQEELIIL